jgi:hypothetical protein
MTRLPSGLQQWAMATDAQGRQLSDDGYYYWDGSAWQPVDQSGASGGASSGSSQQSQNVDAQGRQLSGDGQYYWDGSNWQPVDASGGGGGGGGAQQFAQAMAQAGYNIDASGLPDLSTLQSGVDYALQLYQSLDSTSQSVIDTITTDPGEAAIGLAQAGITGIDALLQAFDQIQGSIGDLLQAAQQALHSAQQTATN